MKLLFSVLMFLSASLAHAGLEFAKTTQEVNTSVEAPTTVVDFEFTNKSNKKVTIAKSDGGCSCMKVQVADGKLTYEPGESGTIRATFEMGNYSGTVEKMVALWLDDDAAHTPSVKLVAKFNIPTLVSIEPKTLSWDMGAKSEPKTMQIKMMEGHTIKIISIKPSSEAFSHTLKTIEDGKAYELTVEPKDITAPALCIFRIETDCAVAKFRTQQAFAVIRRPTQP